MERGVTGMIADVQRFSLHDGPGIRTTIFMKGCPLRCFWCSNPESQSLQPQRMGDTLDSERYTVDAVLELCMQDRAFYEESGGGVTLSGGEPLAQWPFVTALLKALKKNAVHTAMETTGCAQPAIFHQAIADADLLLFDIKHYANDKHKAGTGLGNGPMLDNLKHCVAAGKEVLPRIPVIPGFNDAPEDAKGFSRLLHEIGLLSVQLLPFHSFGESKYELLGIPYAMKGQKPLHAEELTSYRGIFEQNGIAAFFE